MPDFKSSRCYPFATGILTLVVATLMLVLSNQVAAAIDFSRSVAFDIPPQPLSSALVQFANQAGVQFTASADSLSDVTSPGVRGKYRADAALRMLLRDTGFVYRLIDEGTVAVGRINTSAPGTTNNSSTDRSGPFQRIDAGESERLPSDRVRLAQTDSTRVPAATKKEAQNKDRDAPDQEEAGTKLEDIIVTAQKREENLQKVPISVTVFDNEAITAHEFKNVEDITPFVPGLQIGIANGAMQPFLRGVGSTTNIIGNEASVAMYIDGQYFSRLPPGILSLANAERVEVLKGPQGTLFGRNASAGVIQVITEDPSYTPAVTGSLSQGRFDTSQANLYATTGITDKLAADFSFSGQRQGEGWGINEFDDNRFAYLDFWTVRSKWLLEADDNTRITLAPYYAWSKGSTNGAVFPGTVRASILPPHTPIYPLPDFYNINSYVDPYATAEVWGVVFKVEHDFSFARLTNISGYNDTTTQNQGTGTYSVEPGEFSYYGGPTKQITQELQLSSLPGSSLTWIGGLFYYNTSSNYNHYTIIYAPIPGPNYTGGAYQLARSYAAYGQATYEILPRLKFTGGIRYTEDRTSAHGGLFLLDGAPFFTAPPAQQSINKVTFKTALDYEVTDGVNSYFSFSRGYKAALFNLAPYNGKPNQPETNDAYEVGVKTTLFDRRLRLNVAVFRDDVKNPQVQLTTLNGILFSNAGGSRSQGAEFDAEAALAQGLTGRVSVGYDRSVYTDYRNAPSYPLLSQPPYGAAPVAQTINADGNYTPFAPVLTFDIGLDYAFNTAVGQWKFGADCAYNGGFHFEPNNELYQGHYSLFNTRIEYAPTDHFGVKLWGKNLANEQYVTRALTNPSYAGAVYQPAAPRTYGLAVDFKF